MSNVSDQTMRTVILFFLLSFSLLARAADMRSPSDAWRYLIEARQAEPWVVVSSPKSRGYIQCKNMGTFVACPFPVSLAIKPGISQTRVQSKQRMPYPAVAGATVTNAYLPAQQVSILKAVLRKLGLKPEDVYGQVIDEQRRIVGTSYDVSIVLDPSYKDFERLVMEVLREVWQAMPEDGYLYEKDS